MAARSAYSELRQHERFQLHDGVVALTGPSAIRFGRIINISLGGVSLRHFDGENWALDTHGHDIILAGYTFSLSDVPTRIISDIEVVIESPYQKMSERRCSMQFGELTPKQRTRLKDIIRTHSIGEEMTLRLPRE